MIKRSLVILIFISFVFNNCSKTNKSISNSVRIYTNEAYFRDAEKYIEENYEMHEYRIPMRDGKNLFTLMLTPKDKSEKYPVMLCRTPYSIAKSWGKYGFRIFKYGLSKQFYEDKFIFVFQDVRGRFRSEGEFENMRPHLKEYKSNEDIDESTDTFDTIEWLIKNLQNNNGNVGMWGISYPGFYAAAGAVNAHPALKAVSPQAPISDWFWDDFHHNGAYFMSDAFGFFAIFGVKRDSLTPRWPNPVYSIKSNNGYDFFLNELGAVRNIKDKFYKNQIAFWNQFVEHPDYDEFWQERSILPDLKNIKPAMLNVGGLFDAEDLFGSFKIYSTIEKNHAPDKENYLVIGPWGHGDWARTDGTNLGDVKFGTNPLPSLYYRDKIELPFFKHHLKNAKSQKLAEATIYETGTNKWREFNHWPPENIELKQLYLHENGKLSFNKPENDNDPFDEFISDPANPVPFIEDTVLRTPKEYMVADQRFASARPDVLVYQTDILQENITIAGNIMARLKVSTSASDADWVVKIIDVYPDDFKNEKMQEYQQMVRAEIFRGRYRYSFEYPEPFMPNEISEVNFELMDILHTFKKGHKIMVHVQSSWFPLADRNPQKYVENIYKAKEEDYVKAMHKVYRDSENSSHLLVGVLEK